MNAHPFLRVRESGANSRKRLLCLKRTRRPFDAATVRELARSTDLECGQVSPRQPPTSSWGAPSAGTASHVSQRSTTRAS